MPPNPRVPLVEKLAFNDKLVKGYPTDVLIKKLKAHIKISSLVVPINNAFFLHIYQVLHSELADIDQERVDVKSLSAVRKELIHTSLLLHKDKGVRAYVACCLADLLRLYAPDAPYTAHELRDIFQFFLRQLTTGLKAGADAPYYSQYFYLLESLASIKSIVLVCDLPQADDLMTEIFRDVFDLVRQDVAKNVELFLADVLVSLIDEAQTLPAELLDVILSQFMQKPSKTPHPAHKLAIDICWRTSERLQRNVCQYFTDIILQHDDEEEMERIRVAHELIKALSRDCPALLLNVVPQLEEELKVDRLAMRALATEALGEMFGDVKTGIELAKKYQTAWQAWLQRRNDKAAPVRLAFVEGTPGIIIHHAELRIEIEDALRNKLLDPDDKVRAATCRVYGQLDYETALHHVSRAQLQEVASRGMDKKQGVRVEALKCLGRLFKLAYTEIESGDPLATEQLAWIPTHLFKTASTSPELRLEVEEVLYEFLIPLPVKGDDEGAWTDRLLVVVRDLDERGVQALLSISNLTTSRPSAYDRYLECCVKNNGGVIDENEEEVSRALSRAIDVLSRGFLDRTKASEDLLSFAKANESRLYKLLGICIDPQSDLRTLVKSQNEFLRRLEQSNPNTIETLSVLLRRSCLWVYNRSSIPTMMKYLQKGDSPDDRYPRVAEHAQKLLDHASKHCPAIYVSHIVELCKALGEPQHPRLIEVALRALASVIRYDHTLAPTDKRTIERLTKIMLGANPRHAKFAGRALAFSKSRTDLCANVMEKLEAALPRVRDTVLLSHLSVLAQFALALPSVFEERSDLVITFIVKEFMMKPSSPPHDVDAPESDWLHDDQLDTLTRAKLISIKICVNRCLSHVNASTSHDVAMPFLKMLWTLLEHGGSTTANSDDDARIQARMRLQAGIALLKLSFNDMYCKMITANFPLLAVMVQDSSFHVRSAFLTKLISYLASRKLDARFNVIPFLTAHDPEKEIREKVARWYITSFARRGPPEIRVSNFEMIFVRLLHLLAHHPDFSADAEGLADMSKYIAFFVDLLATSDNVSLLFHLAGRTKTVRDSESQEYSKNLYVMSELAQHLIKMHAQAQGWSLPSFPGKTKLPSDIFQPHSSAESLKKVLRTAYLPDIASLSVEGVGQPWKSPSKTAKPSRKRKDQAARITKSNRVKRRKRRGSDSEKSSSPSSSEDEFVTSVAAPQDDNNSGMQTEKPIGRRGPRRKVNGG
ncbi:hypothetical protein FRB98_002995 [Tulasnella sp. 332]|nr:hypothetical protein FRB98_002995 [Tulasnella sp. 332]